MTQFTPGQKLTARNLNNLSQQAQAANYLTNVNKYFNNSQTPEGQLQYNKLINEYGEVLNGTRFQTQTRSVSIVRNGQETIEDALYIKLDARPVSLPAPLGGGSYAAIDYNQEIGCGTSDGLVISKIIPYLTFILGWKTTAYGEQHSTDFCLRLLKPLPQTAPDLYGYVKTKNDEMFSAANDEADTPVCYDDGFGWVWCGLTIQQLQSFTSSIGIQQNLSLSMFLIQLDPSSEDNDNPVWAWVIAPSILLSEDAYAFKMMLLGLIGGESHRIDNRLYFKYVCQIPPLTIAATTTGVLANVDYVNAGYLPYILQSDENFDITYQYPPSNAGYHIVTKEGKTSQIDIDSSDFPPFPDTELALMQANPGAVLSRKTALWLSCDIDASYFADAFYAPLSVYSPHDLELEWKSQVSADPDLSSHTAQFVPVFRLVSLPYSGLQWTNVNYVDKHPTFYDITASGEMYKCGLSSNIVFGEKDPVDGKIPMDVLYI